jgi:hypothetical protein
MCVVVEEEKKGGNKDVGKVNLAGLVSRSARSKQVLREKNGDKEGGRNKEEGKRRGKRNGGGY